jgi:hypothetical protein
MATYFQYLLVSTICVSVFYLAFIIILRKESGFIFLRIYLLSSIIVSLLLPMNRYSIEIFKEGQFAQSKSEINKVEAYPTVNSDQSIKINSNLSVTSPDKHAFVYMHWILVTYFTVAIALIIKLLLGILSVAWLSVKLQNDKFKGLRIIRNDRFTSSFSFFNLVFIQNNDLSNKEIKGVIAHENIHVSQFHTIDLLLVELLSAVMWFNPLVWLLRNSIRQVHEYLADEGVLNIGFDRLEYQALLINQIAESRLFNLASSFNQSQIKNRLIMMTKQKSNNRSKLKILAFIPVAGMLVFFISCFNGTKNKEMVTAIAPTKMNVLYIGLDNPVKIAVSDVDVNKISVTVDNGTIKGEKGAYIINPKDVGPAKIIVSSNGKAIDSAIFRVKYVPDPVAKVGGSKGGEIDRSFLLEQKGVIAELENSDFDLSFKVVQFTVSTVFGKYMEDRTVNSNMFTQEQYDLIKKVKKGNKVYIEGIKAVGPDGTIRQLGPICLFLK